MDKNNRIKEDRDLAESIVETVREPLLVLDAKLRVITANRSFYKIFHVDKKETEGKLLYNLGNGQWNKAKLKYLLNEVISQKTFFQDFEIEHEFPEIGIRVMQLNARKIIQKNNYPPMILLAIEDITEKKQLERQKDDFISIASHELRTPVTSMKIYAQMLQKHPLITSDKKAADMLSKLDLQMNRLTELVASFMNVYKMGSGKLRLNKTTFSLEKLIAESVANFQYTVSSHVVEHDQMVKANIYADRNRISQVLVNIISNAIKYSPDGDTVIVRLSKKAGEVTVSVEDFGMGIPKTDQTRIYERFFRAKGKKEGKVPGLGLGLYISAEIVKQHGGKLWVDSTEGKGSTFYFTLPLRISK
jgi:two-component system, chemotaxis family, CheB/CheR fusion protein